LDASGHGTGRPPATGTPEQRLKDVEKMTAEERAADLKKRGIL
jgi:hypothetical protein